MPGPSGLELLDRVQSLGSDAAVVIITAQNTFENAVEAMKRGALDYLVKPFGMDEVQALVDEGAAHARARARGARAAARGRAAARAPGERLVGRAAAMLEIFKTIGRVARAATCRC